ncbi:unnamed protein product, partial [Dibothriocephalus latus]
MFSSFSHSFAQNRSRNSRSKSNYTNTDESAMLAGLVQKYLSPTLIQKLTRADPSTTLTSCSFANSEADIGLPDVSMATRRYLEHHDLLGDRRGQRNYRDGGADSGRLRLASTPAFSEVAPVADFSNSISTLVPSAIDPRQDPASRFECESSLEAWSALRPSELFSAQPPP